MIRSYRWGPVFGRVGPSLHICRSASPAPIQEIGEDESDPPKKAGDHVAPIAALSSTPLSGPMRGRSRPH